MKEKQAVGDGGGGGGGGGSMGRNEAEKIREMQLTIASSSSVFPGFRFSPTDDELISYYLKKKLQGSDKCVDIIQEVDFCRHEPWDLPALSIIQSDNEWFFFSTRGKKYPNGSQSKRATQSGYWKATGKERNIKSGHVTIGTKRTLVFHIGRAPRGERTEWIMHEYCMTDAPQDTLVVCRLRRNGDFRLTESSRGSSDQRNLSTIENSHSGTNGYANTQRDGFDDAYTQTDGFAMPDTQTDGFDRPNTHMDVFDKPGPKKSRSNESTNSYRSHSIGQNGSESESDGQLIPDSPHGSSSPYKDYDDEDDCFADILNDDIIKLDESSSQSLTFHGVFGTKSMQKSPQQETISSHRHGTAVRRSKPRHQKGQTQHENPPISDGGQNQPPSEKQSSGCIISVLAGNANKVYGFSNPKHMILVFVFLVMLMFVVWQHLDSSMEVIKRQVKYWLIKADEYI